jgi:hypothetical protein
MVVTLYAFLAASGSLGSSNSTVYVVDIDAPFGMPNVLLFPALLLFCTVLFDLPARYMLLNL